MMSDKRFVTQAWQLKCEIGT